MTNTYIADAKSSAELPEIQQQQYDIAQALSETKAEKREYELKALQELSEEKNKIIWKLRNTIFNSAITLLQKKEEEHKKKLEEYSVKIAALQKALK